MTDAPVGDAAVNDAATDAPASDAADAAACPSIDSFCATDASTGPILTARCVRDWATAQTAAAWCPNNLDISIHPGCNGYDFVFQGGVDTSYFYVYDAATGALVGVQLNGLGGPRCVAGVVPALDFSGCSDGGLRGPSICSVDAGGGRA